MEAAQANHIPSSAADPALATPGPRPNPRLTVFVCANCARPGAKPTARLDRPAPPALAWPGTVQQVVVPCSGRLQPEHLLRAFEAGADLVGVAACAGDNCHYLEGSCRAERRAQYVGTLLDQIGLGSGRLMLFHLPGSAREDMAVGTGAAAARAASDADIVQRIEEIAALVAARLQTLPPSPLRPAVEPVEPVEVSEVEEAEENDD